MSFDLTKFKTRLAKLLQEMGAATTDKGVLYWDGEEELKEGIEVWADEERTKAEDGDYTTEDGKVIKVVDGRVAEIIDPAAEVEGAEEPAEETPTETPAEPSEIDALTERIDALEKRIEELAGLIESIVGAQEKMSAEMSAIKSQPIAKPAHEEVKDEPVANKKAEAISRIAEALRKN